MLDKRNADSSTLLVYDKAMLEPSPSPVIDPSIGYSEYLTDSCLKHPKEDG